MFIILLFDYHFRTRLRNSRQQYPHDDDEPIIPNDTAARKRFVVKKI